MASCFEGSEDGTTFWIELYIVVQIYNVKVQKWALKMPIVPNSL